LPVVFSSFATAWCKLCCRCGESPALVDGEKKS
jgi:hypothetical protein